MLLLAVRNSSAQDIRVFNVFGYITLRAVLAALTALMICFIVGPAVIRKLTALKIGQSVRDDGPQTHLTKAGTPTMGGALILVSIAITTLLWADLTNRFVWIVLLVTLGFGAIGWVDDWRKVVRQATPRACASREKYFWQSVIGCCALSAFASELDAVSLFYTGSAASRPAAQGRPDRAVLQDVSYPLGVLRLHRRSTYFVIVGSSNAVNLTDGLDGLAIMPTVMVGGALGMFAYVAGNAVFSNYLGLPAHPRRGRAAVFCGAMAGAGLGFLWFNTYPARGVHGRRRRAGAGRRARHDRRDRAPGDRAVHHGRRVRGRDGVGDVAGGSFKLTGKRMFRMAPLHHHYELKGWKEPRWSCASGSSR